MSGTTPVDTDNSSLVVEEWPYYQEDDSLWQRKEKCLRNRSEKCFGSREMSDIGILSVDENWWFGDTVKDFYSHKFLLGSASPVLHHILYEMELSESSKEIVLNLNPKLNVTLTRTKTYDSERLELNGIPPIATEALLEYIYKDKFLKSDYEHGYSRNLLWRLWHASKALEMDHLSQITSETLDETMCEDTVFWDLNYSMQFNEMGLEHLKQKVLKIMEGLEEKLFEHDNFVWIDHAGIKEILNKRESGSCEPLIIFNNLLRWSLYQVDRVACCEIDDKSGAEIPIEIRLEWINNFRKEQSQSASLKELEKYLKRGIEFMPWTEFSQEEYLKYVPQFDLISNEKLLKSSLELMNIVVNNPNRLRYSEYGCKNMPNTKLSFLDDIKISGVKSNKDASKKSIREICLLNMMDGSKKDEESLMTL
nr:uncharacterized protein LOC121121643 isoform X1 [Lepeophtheirus salmonis]XP_040572544.1 uncharacterized protein LOC121121643 isoform X1 [Lepeophtheirus salmonis]